MTRTVNDIISTATPADLDIIRGFIRDTVRAEWGTLISDLSERTYAEAMPADPFLGQAEPEQEPEQETAEEREPEPSFQEFLAAVIGPLASAARLHIDIRGIHIEAR